MSIGTQAAVESGLSRAYEYAELGSVSEATLRVEDLIPAFNEALKRLDMFHAQSVEVEYEDVFEAIGNLGFQESLPEDKQEDADFCLEVLSNGLEEYAPPLCYFGGHEGDPASIGFWMSSAAYDDQVRYGEVKVLDTMPEYIAIESDHGGVMVYDTAGMKLVVDAG